MSLKLELLIYFPPKKKKNCLFTSFALECQFPIGIDSERFIRALDLPPVQDHIKELQERFKGRKVHFYILVNTFFISYNLLYMLILF